MRRMVRYQSGAPISPVDRGRFCNDCLANLEATRFAPGRKNGLTIEINGSAGSLVFDLEQMNRLQFYDQRDSETQRGFREIIVTEAEHPYAGNWWPPGHLIGYEHSFVHTLADFLAGLEGGVPAQPDFRSALQTQKVCEAVLQSAATGRWEETQASLEGVDR